MRLPLSKEQTVSLLLGLSCLAILAAWVSEYVFGLQACNLCLYQRYIYLMVTLCLAAHLFLFARKFFNLFLILSALLLLLGASVAAYQVAVENHWVALPGSCKSQVKADSLEAFKQQVLSQAHVSCDKVQWSLFGVSMAGYNVFYSLFLSILALIGVFADDKRKKKFARR